MLDSVSSASTDSARLPVKRVVLYKNGIGYFEHQARVHGTQDLAIDFTTGQLNDVLSPSQWLTWAKGGSVLCVITPPLLWMNTSGCFVCRLENE
jgi:hypothetical protein